ncbi:MAG: PAS domain-containing protein [Thermoanaerobaculia bacterium]|nr:PAS domain-containing protein [Thermoanaerobaculia bacterium]MBP9824571.1 PAS domain-containing protein [Thermoanaerobaculia bacterium]
MHSLLERQLRRLLSPELRASPELAPLLAAIDEAYRQSDSDRVLLERSLDLSSRELLQANEELRNSSRVLAAGLDDRTGELERALQSLALEMGERLRVQEALTREETKFRLFIEKLPAISYVAEPGNEGRWLFVSPQVETLLGYAQEEWLADPRLWHSRLHPDDAQSAVAEEQRCVRERDQFSLEYRLLTREGRTVWIRDDAIFLPADESQPDRLQGVMFDVTERRLLSDQLVQAQKVEAIGQLAGGIAHDFNNLLTAITGYAELLLHRLGDNHRYARELSEILRAADRATRVTGKLLAFSHRQPLDPRNLDLNTLLIDVDHLLRRLIGERIQLELSLASGPIMVRAEPTQLEQVVINLVVNARDAMPDGGLVRIATARRRVDASGRHAVAALRTGDYVELSVADSGSGMDAETLRRLFEPFFTTKPVGQGTGLGLAMAYGIVQQSSGTILVESELGKGSAFRILLPLSAEKGETLKVRPGALALPGGRERILLVEDDPAVRDFAFSLLADLGYHVMAASDGIEARAIVEREGLEGFQLLLTDVVMPRLGGAELAREIRLLRPDLPVLFVSGYARNEDQIAALLGPRCLYLQKPFAPAVLAAALRRLLEA